MHTFVIAIATWLATLQGQSVDRDWACWTDLSPSGQPTAQTCQVHTAHYTETVTQPVGGALNVTFTVNKPGERR